ncbi:unnamed protein product [Clonostachys byssicola]|uniref:NADH dehydrogenase [ubiquinone] 1 alpha subcomplex assembly factor 3 n=1 Tax=Clonostachys byssicola TaxID=160290 RepID=A0A9N9Y7W9_9HYPO|nr:unnamed protein product [Clonostachys byssicola]
MMRLQPLQRCACQALRRNVRQIPTAYSTRIASRATVSLGLTPRLLHTSTPQRKRDDRQSQQKPATIQDLDMFGNTPPPSTSVDVCMHDGFGLNSGVTISDGNGALLVNGEAFSWRPWELATDKKLGNAKGQFVLPEESLSTLDLLWPRPDLLIIGTGKNIMPLSPESRKAITKMGFRVDILDTRNAAAQFNLLATERGVSDVAAALVPLGWKDGQWTD